MEVWTEGRLRVGVIANMERPFEIRNNFLCGSNEGEKKLMK